MKAQVISNVSRVNSISTCHISSEDKTPTLPLLSIAMLYGQLRGTPKIWQLILADLLKSQQLNIEDIACYLAINPRTIMRILSGDTKIPSIETSFKLFRLHVIQYLTRYTESFW